MKTKYTMIWIFCIVFFLPWLTPETKAEETESTVTIETDDLNVRSGPGLHHRIVTTLEKGTKYPFIQREKDWIQIQLTNEKKGWVADYLVTVQNEKEAVQPRTANEKKLNRSIGLITGDAVNVRKEPSLSGDIIGKMNSGVEVKVLEVEIDWVKIDFEEGIGWISAQFIDLKKAQSASEQNDAPIRETTVSILHNGTNIRKSPNTQAMILERAKEGDTYTAIQLKDDWYQIKLDNEEMGYVASWIVTELDPDINRKEDKKNGSHSLKNKTIVIDPGHGGVDGGTVGKNGTLEKRLTLETAKKLFVKLEQAGANVILTRNTDLYLPLTSRVVTGYYRNADAFISLHYDNSKDKDVHGLTTYFYHPWQKELAVELHSAAVERTKQNDRGVRFGDYYVIRENNKKAVLIELGYLSNPAEELLVRSDEYQNSAATGIYEGLGRFFHN